VKARRRRPLVKPRSNGELDQSLSFIYIAGVFQTEQTAAIFGRFTMGACFAMRYFLLACVAFSLSGVAALPLPDHSFTIGTNEFVLDGHSFQIRCGEFHAARIPREYWRHRLRMARAMGLNTVCAYLFWNQIEPTPGKFDWSGQADVPEFCRIAQQEGLWVILRPGPYSCAEWEMGGLPWWLLQDHQIQLRTTDPHFLEPANRYLHEVGRVFGPLQITHGGPILMVQVENEYGSYGTNIDYLGQLRQTLVHAGVDVPLFDCDPANDLKKGFRPDLFPVVNFGSNPAAAFKALREILPHGPLMCGEYYPGWFDTWGVSHHVGNTMRYLADLEYMLTNGESFSIYMAHGGTTFGLWSGADRPFKPDTSSYDYDAPISEAGWPTEKFSKTRALFTQHLQPGESLSDPPDINPVISFAPMTVENTAAMWDNLPEPLFDTKPRPMEDYGQGYGCIVYRTTLPPGPAVTLRASAVHDFGFVYLDGRLIKVMDRRDQDFQSKLPPRGFSQTLDILVEAMGRVNFGPEIDDHKGILGPVTLMTESGDAVAVSQWKIYRLPLDQPFLASLHYGQGLAKSPAFWRATANLRAVGDTFLDLRSWGKGVIWINGHCLGRFWNIGPTQTAYVPGPWLKKGRNEIIIFDLVGPQQPVIAGLNHPILDERRPTLDFSAGQ
jgi:beta-galactosidase